MKHTIEYHQMMLIVIVSVPALGCAQMNRAYIQGVTRDCFQQEMYRPAEVDVYLLDPTKSSQVVRLLHDMKTSSARNAWPEFFATYERFEKAVRHSKALGHVKSDKSGAFQFRTVPGIKLLVIGIQDREDDGAFHALQEVETKPGKNELVLNFDGQGHCSS